MFTPTATNSIKNRYIIYLLIAAVVFNFIVLPFISYAQDITPTNQPAAGAIPPKSSAIGSVFSWIGGRALLFISDAISVMLSTFFGLLISIEAKIIDYVLSPSTFSFTNSVIVQTGWRITRDLANMFFILILLIIAFATVLRFKTYAVQSLLFKVVAVALLINFSLVIAGVVIDFSQIITTFFIKQGFGNNFGDVTGKIINAMKITNFYLPNASAQSVGQGLLDFSSGAIAAAAGIILTLVGLVVTAFVFGATAVFLIVRIVNIWFYLIVLPFALFLSILPATSHYFTQWLNNFFKWVFFAPVYAGIMYIAMTIFEATGELSQKVLLNPDTVPPGWKAAAAGLTNASMPSAIFQWILVIYIMILALMWAQQSGIKLAGAAQNVLAGWGEATKNWVGRQARRGYVGLTRPEAPTPPPAGAGRLARFGYRFRQAGAAIGRGALAVPGLREQQLAYMSQEQAAYQKTYDKYKGLDPVLLNQVASGIIADPRARLAVQQLQIEKDQLKPGANEVLKLLDRAKSYGQEAQFVKMVTEKIGQNGWEPADGFKAPAIAELLKRSEHDPKLEQNLLKQIGEEMKRDLTTANGFDDAARVNLLQRAQKYGKEQDFAKFFPNIAADALRRAGETREAAVSRIVSKNEKASDIYEDQLVAEVVRELNPSQLKVIGKSGSNEQRRAAKIAVIQDYKGLNLSDRQSIRIVLLEKDSKKREQLRATLPEHLRKISHAREITTTPTWEHNI